MILLKRINIMRKYDDLPPQDKGVYIARERINEAKALHIELNKYDEDPYTIERLAADLNIFNICTDICNDCLDIATLGEIE
jgi:hypothetical protein